jgi:hypothetical protein
MFNYKFNKISKLKIFNIINLINNVYIRSLKQLEIILNPNLKPEILSIINNVNIQIQNIISLSYNEDLIQFESFYKTLHIKASIKNSIDISDFNKMINLFIDIFYDIDGSINISLLKEIAIKNDVSFNYLLKLLSEVSVDINNLIDLTVNNGANFSLAIRSDSGLFSWGRGNEGQLGGGGVFERSSPVQVGTSSWTQVASGGSHALGLLKSS